MPARRANSSRRARALPRASWTSRDGDSCLYPVDHARLFEQLEDNAVDCVWTDPPYFLSNGGTTCQAGRRVSVDKGGWDRSQGIGQDHAFNQAWLTQCMRVLKPGGTIWVSGTHHVYLSVGMAMLELGFRLLNDIVWEKPNPPPNLGCRCFTHSTEMVLWAAKPGRGKDERYTFHYADMKAQNDGRQMKNVWRFTAPPADEKTFGKHPTQKPLALITRSLEASTSRGELVLDPFAGSGSTGVAAMQLERRFLGAEIDRDYARLAGKRLRAADRTPKKS